MWPHEPDEFESLLRSTEDASRDEALYFLFVEGQVAALLEQGTIRPIRHGEYRWLDVEIHAEHYLGRWRGRDCYAARASGRLPGEYLVGDLRGWLGRVEPSLFYLAGRAKQVIEFHETHRFCGRCGCETREREEERARICPRCELVSYPRLSPSIIVLVTSGERMLLARNRNFPPGMYSTLAGFVEPGESIEQTVHREVLEEVGLRVHRLEYRGSQSWPFPNSLMLGFLAEYAGGEILCQPGEIDDARWFAVDELPRIPPEGAISRWLIDAFIERVRAAR